MSTPPTVKKLTIYRGRTFREYVRWETTPFLFSKIASISNEGPVQIATQAVHGILPGWRVAVVGAKGLTELNAESNPPSSTDFRRATIVDTETIELNELSGADFGVHRVNSGFLQWYTPHPLAGYVARMSIKDDIGGNVLLTSIDTGAISIEIDDASKTITLEIDADDTEPLTWEAGVYDLELEDPDGVVTVILTGSIEVVQEVTTPII